MSVGLLRRGAITLAVTLIRRSSLIRAATQVIRCCPFLDERFGIPQDPEQASQRARCIIERDLGKIDCTCSDEPRYKAECLRKIMASITFHTAKYEEEYPVSRPLPVSHVPKIETDD